MGHSEKLIFCEKGSDTKKLYELLLKYKKQLQIDEILTILTFKRNYIFRHRELIGFKVDGIDVPFTYTSQFQEDNLEHFYYKEWTEEEVEKVSNESANREFVYSEERENFFNKGDMLIWLVGDSRGDMQDIYNIFGFGIASEKMMLRAKLDGELREEYLKEGKIDYRAAASEFGLIAAKEFLPQEEVEILKKARVIDFDGVNNPDKIIRDSTLFKHKPLQIRCYREEAITYEQEQNGFMKINENLILKEIPEEIEFEDGVLRSLKTLHNYWVYIFEKMDTDIDEEEYEEDDVILLAERDSDFIKMSVYNLKRKLSESDKYKNIYEKCKKAIKTIYIDEIEEALEDACERAKEDGISIIDSEEDFKDVVENIMIAGLAVVNLSFYLGYKKSYDLKDLEKKDLDDVSFWKNNCIDRAVNNTVFVDYL